MEHFLYRKPSPQSLVRCVYSIALEKDVEIYSMEMAQLPSLSELETQIKCWSAFPIKSHIILSLCLVVYQFSLFASEPFCLHRIGVMQALD